VYVSFCTKFFIWRHAIGYATGSIAKWLFVLDRQFWCLSCYLLQNIILDYKLYKLVNVKTTASAVATPSTGRTTRLIVAMVPFVFFVVFRVLFSQRLFQSRFMMH
jgi:hypothetical protein